MTTAAHFFLSFLSLATLLPKKNKPLLDDFTHINNVPRSKKLKYFTGFSAQIDGNSVDALNIGGFPHTIGTRVNLDLFFTETFLHHRVVGAVENVKLKLS